MPQQPGTLRDMIKAAHASGLTYDQLAERAVDPETGKTASGPFMNNIANGNVDRMPYDYHLRAIAAGLRVPYQQVREAAIAQWLPEVDPDNPKVATEAMKRELASLQEQVDAMRARLDEEHPSASDAA